MLGLIWHYYNIGVRAPQDPESKAKFSENLLEFHVSVKQYANSYDMENVTV